MNKKFISKIALFLVVISIFTAISTGCNENTGDSEINPCGLVVILGNHANANSITQDVLDNYDELFKKAFVFSEEDGRQKAKLQLNVIISDGKPQLESIDEYLTNKTEIVANTTRNRDLQIKNLVDEIKTLFTSDKLRAKDPEVDLMKAITEAKYALEHMQGDKNILILDSGLPTAGVVDFTKINLQKLSVKEAIDTVPAGSIPDLNGINVYFEGLVNVAFPQSDAIRENEVAKKFVDFWSELLNDSLAAPIKVANSSGNAMLHDDELKNSYPRVSSIAIKPVQIDLGPIPLYSETIGFLPDSADFIDERKAIEHISIVAENLKEAVNNNPSLEIYVVGSIARVNENSERQRTSKYSSARANKVADILIQNLGIPAANIKTIDAGMTEFTWRCADEFEGNEETQAINKAMNRIVYIFVQQPDMETCDELQELIDAGYVSD